MRRGGRFERVVRVLAPWSMACTWLVMLWSIDDSNARIAALIRAQRTP